LPLTPGSTFERYEIQGLIGRGGMGEVYRALDTRLHRPVALKVLRTDGDAAATVADAGGTARLLREARAAAALNHANSVAIYELGEAEGISYIAMELVSGVTLRHYLGEGHVSVDTKVSWLVDAARALWAAHRAGLVHRDVKPGNIMVSEEGVVKVLDFGLAKPVAVDRKPGDFQTLMGQVLGTPRYMAPEQLEGSPADASADQYAFGLTSYELISGVYPGGPLAGAVSALDKVAAQVSPELAAVVARMMSRAPTSRFPTMEAAAHALRSCTTSTRTGMPAKAPPPVARVPPQDRAHRHQSDAPTIVASTEPVSHARELPQGAQLAKGGTLPLAVPFRLAVGGHAAALLASKPDMGKTMPLARPTTGPGFAYAAPSAPSSGTLSPDRGSDPQASARGVVSGVYASGDDARAGVAGSARSRRASRRGWWWLAVVVLAVAAAASGGVAAWLHH
jgi:eukaryotic-like serine/threonine-protein kinase